MSIRNAKRYGEFLYYLERPEIIEHYDSIVLELFRSNSKFPHPDKKDLISKYSRNHFWMISFLCENLYIYANFYDRGVSDILEKTDSEVKLDLHNRYIKFCRDYPNFNLQKLNMAVLYYIKPLVNICSEYRISMELHWDEPELLIPRNFFSVIGNVRSVYSRFCKEVKKQLGSVDCFTDDIIDIVVSYSF